MRKRKRVDDNVDPVSIFRTKAESVNGAAVDGTAVRDVRVCPMAAGPVDSNLAPEAFGVSSLIPEEVVAAHDATAAAVGGQVTRTTVSSDWHADVKASYASDGTYGPLWNLCERARKLKVVPAVVSEVCEALTLQESSRIRNYHTEDGMLYFSGKGEHESRLCIPASTGNSLRLLMLFEAHESGIHGGENKTFARLAERFIWPGMRRDVSRYISSCRSCRLNKKRSRVERGALGALEIPTARWQAVQADWILGLPVTEDGFDNIMVIEDRVTKFAYFIPAKKGDNAEDAAKRAFGTAFCVHGMPETIYSDRDAKFTSGFFGSLLALMHVRQSMGTSHYHDFNGALECLNKTVEVSLRHLIMEFPDRDFSELLPMAQWAYNTSLHSAIRMSPYEAMFGVKPRQVMEFVVAPGSRVPPTTAAFAKLQQEVLIKARDALFKAQEAMLAYENRDRKEAEFAVEECVFLSTVNLGKSHFDTTVKKLRPAYCGPFRIVERCSAYTYRLDLPAEMRQMHPVFHVSLLWRAVPTPRDMAGRLGPGVELPPASVAEPSAGAANADVDFTGPLGAGELTHADDGEELYVMEKILGKKGRGRFVKYLVKWQGWDVGDATWEPMANMETEGAARFLVEYDERLRAEAAAKAAAPAI